MKDPRELLVEVEKAIGKILSGGQSYRIGTRSVTRADLSTLISMRDMLKAEAEQSDAGFFGRTSVAEFEGR
ncbi:MAG: peptidylprolyl isomerase [Anaerotignum sp.]|nr:peptidylprolyl isomerase [Anaerotignum sp.]